MTKATRWRKNSGLPSLCRTVCAGSIVKYSNHALFAIILLLFLIIFFTIHHHIEKTCVILFAGNLDQTIKLIRSQGICRTPQLIYLFLSFFCFRFSFSVCLLFFCSSRLPLSLFPLSPISSPLFFGI